MAQRFSNYPVIHETEGELTNPSDNDTVADTGAITAAQGGGGVYEILVVASASAAAHYLIQRRNAADDANVGNSHVFYAPAGAATPIPYRFELLLGERIRVTMDDALTGTTAVSIFAQRVG